MRTTAFALCLLAFVASTSLAATSFTGYQRISQWKVTPDGNVEVFGEVGDWSTQAACSNKDRFVISPSATFGGNAITAEHINLMVTAVVSAFAAGHAVSARFADGCSSNDYQLVAGIIVRPE